MQELSSFSMLFELGAALNLAFIAVEYTASFTIALAKNVFGFFTKIDAGVAKCGSHIDYEIIKSLREHTVDGNTNAMELEDVRRTSEILRKKIQEIKKQLQTVVTSECKSRCFSCLCLYMFLYCVVAGFTMAYNDNDISTIFWTLFVWLSVGFSVVSFTFGEIFSKAEGWFCSFVKTVIIWAVVLIISLCLSNKFSGWLFDYSSGAWETTLFVSALLPFTYFGLLVLSMKKRSSEIHRKIDSQISELDKECTQLEEKISKLHALEYCSAKFSSDNQVNKAVSGGQVKPSDEGKKPKKNKNKTRRHQ